MSKVKTREKLSVQTPCNVDGLMRIWAYDIGFPI